MIVSKSMILSLSYDMITCCTPLYKFKHLGGASGTTQLLKDVTIISYCDVIISYCEVILSYSDVIISWSSIISKLDRTRKKIVTLRRAWRSAPHVKIGTVIISRTFVTNSGMNTKCEQIKVSCLFGNCMPRAEIYFCGPIKRVVHFRYCPLQFFLRHC